MVEERYAEGLPGLDKSAGEGEVLVAWLGTAAVPVLTKNPVNPVSYVSKTLFSVSQYLRFLRVG